MRPFDRGVAAAFVVLLAFLLGVSYYGWQTVEDLRGEVELLQGAAIAQGQKLAFLEATVTLIQAEDATFSRDERLTSLEASISTIQFDLDDLQREITRTMGTLQSDLETMRSDIRAIEGPFWTPLLSRNMTDLNDDLALVEECLRSIAEFVDRLARLLPSPETAPFVPTPNIPRLECR